MTSNQFFLPKMARSSLRGLDDPQIARTQASSFPTLPACWVPICLGGSGRLLLFFENSAEAGGSGDT